MVSRGMSTAIQQPSRLYSSTALHALHSTSLYLHPCPILCPRRVRDARFTRRANEDKTRSLYVIYDVIGHKPAWMYAKSIEEHMLGSPTHPLQSPSVHVAMSDRCMHMYMLLECYMYMCTYTQSRHQRGL